MEEQPHDPMNAEIAALRRMALIPLPPARIARARVRIKRRLRRAGVNPELGATIKALAAHIRLLIRRDPTP